MVSEDESTIIAKEAETELVAKLSVDLNTRRLESMLRRREPLPIALGEKFIDRLLWESQREIDRENYRLMKPPSRPNRMAVRDGSPTPRGAPDPRPNDRGRGTGPSMSDRADLARCERANPDTTKPPAPQGRRLRSRPVQSTGAK